MGLGIGLGRDGVRYQKLLPVSWLLPVTCPTIVTNGHDAAPDAVRLNGFIHHSFENSLT